MQERSGCFDAMRHVRPVTAMARTCNVQPANSIHIRLALSMAHFVDKLQQDVCSHCPARHWLGGVQ